MVLGSVHDAQEKNQRKPVILWLPAMKKREITAEIDMFFEQGSLLCELCNHVHILSLALPAACGVIGGGANGRMVLEILALFPG